MVSVDKFLAVEVGTQISLNDTELSLVECFERRARIHHARTAIGSGEWQPTYRELNDAANHLAHALLGSGGSRGDRVAIMMQQDNGRIIAAILGVMKAARIVVVLNPNDPVERLQEMIASAEPTRVIADSSCVKLAMDTCGPHQELYQFEDSFDTSPTSNPSIQISADELAVITFTSGSTGRPKGVLGTHRKVLHHVYRCTKGMDIQVKDRIAALSSLGGGQGFDLVWCALLNGATACPIPVFATALGGLADSLRQLRVTILASATSVLRHLMQNLQQSDGLPDVRLVRIGAEATFRNDLTEVWKYFPESCVLMHAYSSTESGNLFQRIFRRGESLPDGLLTAGRPGEGIEILIVDDAGCELPQGEIGTIVVRSRYLSPGYWRDEARTQASFSQSGNADSRIYHTGDHGWFSPQGEIFITGRKDDHVNIHGHTIELSEIEAALLRQKEVGVAVVLARPGPNGNDQIVAFVTPRAAGIEIKGVKLREALGHSLPGHMIPSVITTLKSIPLTPTGKPAREKLLKDLAESEQQASIVADAPRTDTEKLMAIVWSQVLKREHLGRDDDFFQLGGDSLSVVMAAVEIHAEMHVHVDLRLFMEHPTLAALASAVDVLRAAAPAEATSPLVRVSREEPLPLSLFEERSWKFSQTQKGAAGYTTAGRHLVRGPINVDVLRDCLTFLACRHEMLRTSFPAHEGVAARCIHPETPEQLPLVDLSNRLDAEEEATRIFREEYARPIDLAHGPMQRFILICIRQHEHQLLRIGHHINSDAWAWKVYFAELTLVYEAKLRGEAPPLLDSEPLQYADYAVWQRRKMGSGTPAYLEALEWWTKKMAGLPPPLDLPFRRSQPAHNTDPSEGTIRQEVDVELSCRLRQFAREQSATFYTVRLAAFAAMVADETSQPDVVLGTYVTNRNQLETQKMFGNFANLVTLRLLFDPGLTFREWVSKVGGITSEFQSRGEIPYEWVCDELRHRSMIVPEVRMIFAASDEWAAETASFGDCKLTKMAPREAVMSWGFSMFFSRRGEQYLCSALFDATLYDPVGVKNLLDRLLRFLEVVSSHPDAPLSSVLAECARND
ncbi:hypothetical protein BH11VER1_BH11VER1_09800 [soil metagenome]